MRYGFIIDNRKCIGCHACTTACKSEHEVPVGVNRTWVKQVEKGNFPHTRRLFSVMRCNHCTDAPCVEICPVEALFTRDDGIVDFDKNRCIGCKSCMQACPYDALYIDPDNNTAAKCNYCAHRVDLGLEPACVNVCPEHAIISGDMDDPNSEISQLLSREQVTVRKAEKGTEPNLFYINGDYASLNPGSTEKSDQYFWSSQSLGVGHYAKYAEKLSYSNPDVVDAVLASGRHTSIGDLGKQQQAVKSIALLLKKPRLVYDAPDKGILWGWEVSAYVWTKAISSGIALLLAVLLWSGAIPWDSPAVAVGIILSLVFLAATGALLVKDLDRPDRFLSVLLRPHWGSWLVKGGYTISAFGAMLTLWLVSRWLGWEMVEKITLIPVALFSLLTSVYTAFLFAQAKGRDFWQSPLLPIHMIVHSVMAGSAFLYIWEALRAGETGNGRLLLIILVASIVLNMVSMFLELVTPHPTTDAKKVASMIWNGKYSTTFWVGVMLIGNLVPLLLLLLGDGNNAIILLVASVLILAGIYLTERIWVEAPQKIALS